MPRFQKGQSGNPAGKPRGAVSKISLDVRQMALKLLDREYWEQLNQRIHDGSLHPKLEEMVWHYAFGQPPREVQHSGAIVHLGALAALQDDPGTIEALPITQDDNAAAAIDGISEISERSEQGQTCTLVAIQGRKPS